MRPDLLKQLQAKAAAEGVDPKELDRLLGKKRKHKYGATRTTVDGIRFDSKLEARKYLELKALQQAGEIRYFLMQTTIHLPGNVRMRIDFQVHHNDGRVQYIDTKGHVTRDWMNKKKIAESLYPIKIEVVK